MRCSAQKAGSVAPEKDDLIKPHTTYLDAWSQCLNGVHIILQIIATRGREGSTLDATARIDQGVKSIEAFPESLQRHAMFTGPW